MFCCVVHWLSLPPCHSACGRIILALIGRSSKQSAWRRRVFTSSRLMKSGRRSRARSPPGGSNGMTVGAGIGNLIHGRGAIGHGLDGSWMNLVDGLESLPPRKCRAHRLGAETLVSIQVGCAAGGSLLYISADGRIFDTSPAAILGIILSQLEDDRVHGRQIPQHRGPDNRRTTRIGTSSSSSGANRGRCACGSPVHPTGNLSTTSTSGEVSESLPPLNRPKVRSKTTPPTTVKGKHKMTRLKDRREASEGSDNCNCATSTECGWRVAIRHQLQNKYQFLRDRRIHWEEVPP